jgi:hypothetical protein
MSTYLRNDNALKMTYYDLVDSPGEAFEINSDIYRQFYVKSAIGCKVDKSPHDCQMLANLCVLKLYDEKSSVCKLYRDILKEVKDASTDPADEISAYAEQGWVAGLPWLTYDQTP